MKKLALLAMAGILALTAVGFGFAKWSSAVDANVKVNTGTLQIGIRDVGTNDDGGQDAVVDFGKVLVGPNLGNYGADPQFGKGDNREMKDVASLVSTNDPSYCEFRGLLGDTRYYNAITEKITNGYPWYGPTTNVEVANLGTIPVKLEAFDWSWVSATGKTNLDPWFDIVNYTITEPNGTVLTGTGKAAFQTALGGIQLHGKEVLKVNVQFGLNELKAGTTEEIAANLLPQNANGEAVFHVTASQWNEVK